MDEDNLNLQVVVKDEVVDLRGNEFGQIQASNSQNSSKKTNNAVKRAGDAGDKKSFVNTAHFKNFARNVTLATGKRNLVHRHRNATNPNRPVSADPRFRRRRSPERLPNTSQSTAVLETASDQPNNKIIKSHSASASAFNRHHKSKHLEMLTLEQGTMTDVTQQNDVPLRNPISNYETAIMDLKFTPKSDETCSINTVIDFGMQKSKQISPYWNDPRLVEKHCDVLKPPPPPTKAAKSRFTCPRCFYECERTLYCESYKYDDCTVIDDCGLSEKTINTEFEKNPNLLTSFMIGSFCGLIIVSVLIWLVNPTEIWRYYIGNRVEKDTSTGIAYVAKHIAGAVLHCCDCIITAVLRLLVLPRNKVYSYYNNNEKGDEPSYWSFFR